MRGVVWEGVGSVRVRDDLPDPRVEEPRDAVIRVTLASICGSDLHYLHGKTPFDRSGVIGHEAVGVIEDVGAEVSRFAVGDRAVVAFTIACGRCWFCRHEQPSLCEDIRMLGGGPFLGSLAGAQAGFVRVPDADENLLAIPDGLDDERALFLGDALTTGFYGAAIGGVRPDDTVAVVGAGPIGSFGVQAARALGARAVVAIEPDPARRDLAARMGAIAVDPGARHPSTALAELTEGRGADVTLEAVGDPSALGSAIDLTRRGGTVVVLGVYASEVIDVHLGAWWAQARTVRFVGLSPVQAWWERALREVVAGRIDPTAIVSHRLDLGDAARGYDLFDTRAATKVVLVP